MDPVTAMNLLFDLAILFIGVFVYRKGRNVLALWVAVAFCLFAISYVLTIIGVGNSLFLIPLRALGYLSVMAGLILLFKRRVIV